MNKKILFAAYSLDIGGIETALVTLVNRLAEEEYDITLVLEKKQGIFLDQISNKIKIIEYTPCCRKNKFVSKLKNAINRCKFIAKYKNKFDCAISYATYSLPSSFIARTASKNSVLWVHSEYLLVCENNINEYINFFRKICAEKFKKIVFVSNSARVNYEKIMGLNPNSRIITINNLINYKAILSKAEGKVTDIEKVKIPTFLFVGRHTEEDKRISRLINASEMLKKENMKFRVLIIGDGRDTNRYKKDVQDKNLEENVIFLGKKKNPYPYFRISDCLVLTSEHEGFPVVYIEAMILDTPIITTNVSDSEAIIKDKYGIVTDKNEESIYKGMKDFINKGFKINQKFDAEMYNSAIMEKIYNVIEGEK